MAIRNVSIFGSFDTSNPGFGPQSDAFAGACKTLILQYSGVNCEIRNSPKPNIKGKSGQPVAVKALLRLPSYATAEEARNAGSMVGLTVTSDTFKDDLISSLFEISGYNALLDIDCSLSTAISNNPPGLITDPGWTPGPGVVTLDLTLTSETPTTQRYAVSPAAELATDAEAAWQGIVTPMSDGGNYNSIIQIRELASSGVPQTASLQLTQTATVDGTPQVFVISASNAPAVEPSITKDGSPAGSLFTSGLLSGTSRNVIVRLGLDSEEDPGVFTQAGKGYRNPNGGRFRSYSGDFSLSSGSLGNGTVLMGFTNSTGSVISAGTSIMDLMVNKEVVPG